MNSEDINRFTWMYSAADKNPVIMKSEELNFIITENKEATIANIDFKLE